MANLIDFGQAYRKKHDSESVDLSQLLRQASLIFQKRRDIAQKSKEVIGAKRVKTFFEQGITDEIINRKLIERDILLCGIYVANILADLASTSPESWWAIDYATSKDPSDIKKGGDVCFIICSVFPERGDHRLMDVSYYRDMGAGFYSNFYGLTKKEIGYHMSRRFETMAEIVKEVLS